MDAEFNGEGAPQAGVAAVGPDLSNAAEYAAGRLEYEDAVSGGTRRAAQVREWLALHLYNPREPQFKKPWTVCPSMPGMFEERPVRGMPLPWMPCLSGWSRAGNWCLPGAGNGC